MAGPLGGKGRGQTLTSRVLRKGAGFVGRRIARRIPLGGYRAEEIGKMTIHRGLVSRTAGVVIARLATRSLPGTLLVGGGMLAKALYDRRRSRRDSQGDPAGDSRE